MAERSGIVVSVAIAISTTVVILCGGFGGIGALLGSAVDLKDGLANAGIFVEPETAKFILHWGFTTIAVVAIWIFAFFFLRHWRKQFAGIHGTELTQQLTNLESKYAELQEANKSLQVKMDDLQESNRRVEIAQQKFFEQAKYHRGIETAAQMTAWMSGTEKMVRGTLVGNIASAFRVGYPSTRDSYPLSDQEKIALVEAAASLRTIAINLKPEHLN